MPRVGSNEVDVPRRPHAPRLDCRDADERQGPGGRPRCHPRRGQYGARVVTTRSQDRSRCASGGDPSADILDPRGLVAARPGRSCGRRPASSPGGRGDRAAEPRRRGSRPVRAVHPSRGAGAAVGRRRRPAGHPGASRRCPARSGGLRRSSCRAAQDLSPRRRDRAGGRAGPHEDRGQVRPRRDARPDPRAVEHDRAAVCLLPPGAEGWPRPRRADRREVGARWCSRTLKARRCASPSARSSARCRKRARSCPSCCSGT